MTPQYNPDQPHGFNFKDHKNEKGSSLVEVRNSGVISLFLGGRACNLNDCSIGKKGSDSENFQTH